MDPRLIIIAGALLGGVVFGTVLWILYLLRLVQNNEKIQDFKRSLVRKREMKVRAEEDKQKKRMEESSKIKETSREFERKSLYEKADESEAADPAREKLVGKTLASATGKATENKK